MTELLQKRNDELVLNKSHAGESSALVTKLETSLRDVKLETRLTTTDGLYVGSVYDLLLEDNCRVYASCSIQSYKQFSDESAEPKTLGEILKARIFGQIRLDLETDNKKYSLEWEVRISGNYNFQKARVVTVDYGSVQPDANLINSLKSETVNRKGIILSDTLMAELFKPIYSALIEACPNLMRSDS